METNTHTFINSIVKFYRKNKFKGYRGKYKKKNDLDWRLSLIEFENGELIVK